MNLASLSLLCVIIDTIIDTKYSDFQQGTYDDEIYVSRRLQTETNLTDSGCVEYQARFDVNNDGWYDLVSADYLGPNISIWLGSKTGYSPMNCLTYPVVGGGNCDIADLNLDGYAELIHCGHWSGNFCIYWGTGAGPSSTDTTLLPNGGCTEVVYVADFDRDTYLDIAGGDPLYVYWGTGSPDSGTGYSQMNLGPAGAEHNIESADLDGNGLLDIITIQKYSPFDVIIFYQDSARYFHQQHLDFADTDNAHGLSIADLNKDGFIDIIATSYALLSYSSIYWGSSSGYSNANKLNLYPGGCCGGSAVADFNNDSLVDILYYRGLNEWVYMVIYYNLGYSPWFSDTNTRDRIGIPVKASGGTVADFNKDSNLDIFVNNRSDTANSFSYVFYGPDFTSYDSLPVNMDHHGTFRQLYQRANYYSRVVMPCSLAPDTFIVGGNVSWLANTQGNSRVDIFVRVGKTSVPDSLWTDWEEVSGNPGPLPAPVLNYGKYIQYCAKLWWENPAELPNLERVEMDIICGSIGIQENAENVGTGRDLSIQIIGKRIIFYSRNFTGRIEIYDVSGRLINSISLSRCGGRIFETKINTAGIYFIRNSVSRRGGTKKVIII